MAKSDFAKKMAARNLRYGIEAVADCFGTGMDSPCRVVPENVLAWTRNEDLSAEKPLVHQRFVLLVCCHGGCPVRVDGRDFELRAGEAMLWLPFQVHRYGRSGEGDEMLVVTFTAASGGASLTPLSNRILTLNPDDEERLLDVLTALQQPERLAPATAIAGLCGVLGRWLESEREGMTTVGESRLAAILEYVNQHAEDSLSVKTVADRFGMTPESLRRLFHARFGTMTPKDYLRRIRLRRAYELLLRTEKRIGVIARECGFADAFVFSRAFKREAGCSPRAYRMRIAARKRGGK